VKRFLPILTLFFYTVCEGQIADSVLLRWNIEPGERLTYLMFINQNTLTPEKSDTTQASINMKDIFYGPKEAYSGTDTFICNLTQKRNNIIDINFISVNESIRPTGADTSTAPMWMKLNSGDTVLRGSVYENGAIHSFYLTDIDYLGFYFQLPAKKIKIGDSWPVDFNCIYFNEGFICDSAYKLNSVTLSDIKTIKNETVAIITYDLIEYAAGNDGGIFGEKRKILIEFKHKAIGQFSLTKGRWLSYEGTQEFISKGIMSSRTKNRISLIPQD